MIHVDREFELLGLPVKEDPKEILDVAIIGAGQSGLGLALCLRKHQITNVQLFDRSKVGVGQWNTTARMLTHRTPKQFPGPALEFAHLTFRSWYEERGGNWDQIVKVPTLAWAQYLDWFRDALHLPVQNEWDLQSINADKNLIRLTFDQNRIVYTQKVVLATGRDGAGGLSIPAFVKDLPRSSWYHTGEIIDPKKFMKKKVCVIGAAASAFDVAAVALENGAESVKMLMRRDALPESNPSAEFKGWLAYYFFEDSQKIEMQRKNKGLGCLVPPESVERATKWNNFELMANTEVIKAKPGALETNRGDIFVDLFLLGTGYEVDLAKVPELSSFSNQILLWRDKYSELDPRWVTYPYLGPHFEFKEKTKGGAPYLKDIYCFNYGAFLSHGRIAGDIDVLPIGLNRLAEGIARDLLIKQYSPDSLS